MAILHVTIIFQPLNIRLQFVDIVLSLLNRSIPIRFLPPSANFVFLFADASLLGVDFGADLAFFGQGIAIHDQFYAAGLASAVFLGAVLSEVAPLPAPTSHFVCVVETHFDGWLSEDDCLPSGVWRMKVSNTLKLRICFEITGV